MKLKILVLKILMQVSSIVFLLSVLGFTFSCTYDSKEDISPSCDTTMVTYSITIKPILVGNCIACHSGPTPAGNLDFENFSDLSSVANNGRLVGSINHRMGFVPMPLSLPKLPECDIMKIEQWVSDGALNN